jgi:hypothetical protein
MLVSSDRTETAGARWSDIEAIGDVRGVSLHGDVKFFLQILDRGI